MGWNPRTDDPDLRLGGFSLWVNGRQFPDLNDYWDGNWLRVEALVKADGARVRATGPIIHSPELLAFADQLIALDQNPTGSASLKCMEPELDIEITVSKLGKASMIVSITPDHLKQQHRFEFELDQTYFRPAIASLERILSTYPIKDREMAVQPI